MRVTDANLQVETDFYGYYAPHAMSILKNGVVLVDEFRGPVYPIILAAFVGLLDMDYHSAAILINILFLCVSFCAIYIISKIVGVDPLPPFLLFGMSPLIIVYTIQAGTDIVFMAVSTLSVAMALKRKWAIFGVFSAVAVLTRSNGVALLAIPIILAVMGEISVKDCFKSLYAPVIAMVVWGFYTLGMTGSFLPNANYLNTGALSYKNKEMYWYDESAQHNGWIDVFTDPQVVSALFENIPSVMSGIASTVAIPVFVFCSYRILKHRELSMAILIIAAPMFLTHVSDRFYIPLLPLLSLGFSNE